MAREVLWPCFSYFQVIHDFRSFSQMLAVKVNDHFLGEDRQVKFRNVLYEQLVYHLVMTNIAIENGPFIDDFPS